MEQYVHELIQIQQQLRIFHWQTKSYARHKAYGETYESLGDLIDEFVETHMGKYGRFQLAERSVEITNTSDTSVKEFINASISFLIDMSNSLDPERDTDLLNIRDEMLGLMNKLKYLLSLE
jgi:DNA-binding ferritin-like protein